MKKEFVALQLYEVLKKMVQYWENQAPNWSKKMKLIRTEIKTLKLVEEN